MSPRARKQPPKTMAAPTAIAEPSERPDLSGQSRSERIAQRAYAIYERRGGQDGSPMDDWLQAEREIDDDA